MFSKTIKYYVSPSTLKICKITFILAIFCFAECAAGACISYGHSCWGAHGKRNGADIRTSSSNSNTVNSGVNSRTTNDLIKNYDLFRNVDEDGGIFYSRLIDQIPRLLYNNNNNNRRDNDLINDTDLINKMKNMQMNDVDLDDFLIPDTNGNLHEYNKRPRERAFDKIRFLNYFKTNADKLN